MEYEMEARGVWGMGGAVRRYNRIGVRLGGLVPVVVGTVQPLSPAKAAEVAEVLIARLASRL